MHNAYLNCIYYMMKRMLGTFNAAFPRMTNYRRMENNPLSIVSWLWKMTIELYVGTTG
jgi:hypothetical protein